MHFNRVLNNEFISKHIQFIYYEYELLLSVIGQYIVSAIYVQEQHDQLQK
jgi:hypothetical protein